VLGDETFFEIMKAWYDNASTKFKSAYTDDFRQVCEQVSGLNLEKFFEQWIYGEYYPVYSYGFKVNQVSGGFNVNVYIDQKQDNTGLFWMPIDVRIYTQDDSIDFVAWDSLSSQQFTFFVENEALNVKIDPDDWILKETRLKLVEPELDKGTLLVNGMNWIIPGVIEAFEDRAFWGTAPVSFWDIFAEPVAGYPESLPQPIGQGQLLAQTLGQYSTVIWLSSDKTLDRQNWLSLPMADYLQAGGNIIFISQSGKAFIKSELENYLGISWDVKDNLIIQDFESAYKGLYDMGLSASMVLISVFDTVLTQESSTLLYQAVEGFESARGVGVWSNPAEGGDFVYLAARPWQLNHQQMQFNMLYMLENFMNEPIVSLETTAANTIPAKFEIRRVYPNPFNPGTRIDFSLSGNGKVTIKIYNILGKQVAQLFAGRPYQAGLHSIRWEADNLASGIYFIQLQAGGATSVKKAILLK
jgi:Secretion system C-terminal sorting domain